LRDVSVAKRFQTEMDTVEDTAIAVGPGAAPEATVLATEQQQLSMLRREEQEHRSKLLMAEQQHIYTLRRREQQEQDERSFQHNMRLLEKEFELHLRKEQEPATRPPRLWQPERSPRVFRGRGRGAGRGRGSNGPSE